MIVSSPLPSFFVAYTMRTRASSLLLFYDLGFSPKALDDVFSQVTRMLLSILPDLNDFLI